MAVPGLYIPIRGDYSEFQKDMARLRGIAGEEGTRISEALRMAISPKDAVVGLTKIGAELKKLTAAAQSTGRTLNAPVEQLTEFAQKANVAASVVEELHYEMLKTARDRQLESALRSLQKQCGLTEDAVARLQAHMGDTAGSIDTAMKALGVRSAQAIKKEMASLEASFDHAIKHGNLTIKEQKRLVDALEKKWAALNAEMGVMPVKHPFFAAKETLGVRETGDVMAEARQARQAYETIQQSAWKTREMSVASHDAMIASLKKLAQELRLTASETSKFIAAFAGSRDALDSAMGSAGLRSTRAIRQEIAEVNRLLHRVESSAEASLEDKERMRAWAVNRTDALTREMRMPGQLTANERYEQATGLLGMKTDAQYRQQAKGIVQAYLEVKTNARSSAEDVQRAHARMIESFRRLREEMNSWRPQAAPRPLYETDPAKVLGMRSNKEILADIAAVQYAFNNFAKVPGRAADEVARAKERMEASIRELRCEMGWMTAQDRRDGFLNLLGIRSVADIEKDKQALINAHRQIVDEFQRGVGGWTQQDLRNSLAARNAGLERLSREAGTWQDPARAQISPLRQKYDKLASQVGRASPSFSQFETRNTARNAVNAFQELNGRLPRAREIREIAAACGASATQIRRMRDELDHSSSAFKALIGYGQVWLTFGFVHTAQEFIKTAMALDNVKVAFTAIYGSADMAEKKLEYVRQVSDQLGLSFMDTAEGAKKLFAAAQGTPVEKDANMVFKSFSDMSAALKLTGDETKGVFLAISQMISKGKVSAEELRQQLAERMPGAVNLFAKSIGVTTKQLDKMLQQGEVTLEHFLAFSREVGSTYASGAQMASHSLQAELNRLKNTWVEFQAGSVDTGALSEGVRQINGLLKGTLDIITKLAPYAASLAKIGLASWMASSLIPGGKLNAILAGLATATTACIGPIKAFIAATASAVVGAGTLTAALKALGTAMMTVAKNPAFLAVMAVGAVAVSALVDSADAATKSFSKVTESMDEMEKKRRELMLADQSSNFTPHAVIVAMDKQISERIKEFEEERNKLQAELDRFLTYNPLNGAKEPATPNQKAVFGMAQQLDDFKNQLREAASKNDITAIDMLGKRFWSSWTEVKEKLKSMKIGEDVKESIQRAWAGFAPVIDETKVDVLKKMDALEKGGGDALVRLGVSFSMSAKEAKKFNSAIGSSDMGKFFQNMEKMDNVRILLGDADMAFNKATAAAAEFGEKAAKYIEQLSAAPDKLEAHREALDHMASAVNHGTLTADEHAAAIKRVQDEDEALQAQTRSVSQEMIQFALAAGGTGEAFNLIIQLCQNSADAFKKLGIDVNQVINDIRNFQSAAAEAIFNTAAIAGADAIDRQILNTEMGIAVKENNKEKFMQLKREGRKNEQIRQQLPFNEPSDVEVESWNREFTGRRKLAELGKSGKGGKGGGGSKRVDNTAEKYQSSLEGFRKEIAKLRGETDKVTLDKKFADMDKQLVGSKHNIQQLKKEYYEAFNIHSLHEFEKTMFQLVGNEKALADIDIEEKLKAQQAQFDGMNKAAQELGLATVDYTAKMEAYRKALQNNSNEQWLEKQIPVYQEIAIYEKDKTKVLELQNQLIDIQAEKMANTFPPEVVERWKEVQRLQNATDAWSGVRRGFNSIAKDSMNAAQFMENTMTQTYDILSEGFTNFVNKGKVDMQDLLNSWINMVNQMVMKAAMSKVFDLIGGLFSTGAGALSGAAGGIQMGSTTSSIGSSISAGAMAVSALGNVFTGLHGWANQIVTRPTLFSYGSQITKFAKGGVMGEAGPEAIMPLTRTASGHLGVRTDGAAAPQSMSVTLVISDQTEGGVKADATGGELDGKQIAVIVKQVENAMVARSLNGKSQYTKYLDRTRGLSNAKQLY